MELTRIKNDINGNPRVIVHFTELITGLDEAKAKANYPYYFDQINFLERVAMNRARKIGGKKYRGKFYGGGIVFQCYSETQLIERINEIKNK